MHTPTHMHIIYTYICIIYMIHTYTYISVISNIYDIFPKCRKVLFYQSSNDIEQCWKICPLRIYIFVVLIFSLSRFWCQWDEILKPRLWATYDWFVRKQSFFPYIHFLPCLGALKYIYIITQKSLKCTLLYFS